MFDDEIVFLEVGVTTLQGRLVNKSLEALVRSSQQESGGACAILGMTLSRRDLVLVRLSREKCSATQGDSLVA